MKMIENAYIRGIIYILIYKVQDIGRMTPWSVIQDFVIVPAADYNSWLQVRSAA